MSKYLIPATAVCGVLLVAMDAMGRSAGAPLISGCILIGSALIARSLMMRG